MKAIILAAILVAAASSAQARGRYVHAHPDCNVLWPCEGVVASPRGEKVVKAMRGFGTARKIYRISDKPRRRHHEEVRAASKHPVAKAEPPKGDGVVRAASGAVAYVARHATAAFQCVVDKLEAAGYRIKEMGGFASRGHIPGSLHYRGLALDVNQLERNVTSPRMPSNEVEIANGCGLVSGAQWKHADSGHFQLGGYDGRPRYAHHRRHKVRLARRME